MHPTVDRINADIIFRECPNIRRVDIILVEIILVTFGIGLDGEGMCADMFGGKCPTSYVRFDDLEVADWDAVLVGVDEEIFVEDYFVDLLVLVVVYQPVQVHQFEWVPAHQSQHILVLENLSDLDERMFE